MQALLHSDKKLGDIATTLQATAKNDDNEEENSPPPALEDWQLHWTQLMRNPDPETFLPRFHRMFSALANYSANNADSALLALVQLSAEEVRFTAPPTACWWPSSPCWWRVRKRCAWPEAQVQSLGKAALSMNIAMAQLQDDLALQRTPLERRTSQGH